MENKPDIGNAIINTLNETRRLLNLITVNGRDNHAALVSAANAIAVVLGELVSGRVVVTVASTDKDAKQENA